MDCDGGYTNALTQVEIPLHDEAELRFKIPHKGIIKNQKKEHASGNREALTHTFGDWWKAN